MTSKERVLTVLNGQIPDRVPWGEHAIDYNIYEMFLNRTSWVHAKFRETKGYWEGRNKEIAKSYMNDIVDLTLALDMDIVTVPFLPSPDYHPMPMEQTGSDEYRDENGYRYKVSSVTGDLLQIPINTAYFKEELVYEQVCERVDELKRLPPLSTNVDIPEYAAVNYAVEKLGKSHFLIAPVDGIEWPRFGTTEEDSWANLLMYPEISEKIAEYIYYRTVRELDRIAATGVDGVLSVGDLGSSHTMSASPKLYRQITLPYHKMLYEECKKRGLYVMRHCCGYIWPIIGEIAEYNDAYESIQESAGMDILKLKEAVGDRIVLWGGVQHEHIHGGTPEQVYEDAKRAILGAGKNGGLILGSSHSLTVGATKENVLSMKKALDDFGKYN